MDEQEQAHNSTLNIAKSNVFRIATLHYKRMPIVYSIVLQKALGKDRVIGPYPHSQAYTRICSLAARSILQYSGFVSTVKPCIPFI